MARYQLRTGPIPLHHQVYLDVRAAIEAGEWSVGDRLPAERDLALRYGCSLITVRRALDDLSREGRLERARGRGTFVTAPPIIRDIAARASFA
jgi:GntR family transcriptional regulator